MAQFVFNCIEEGKVLEPGDSDTVTEADLGISIPSATGKASKRELSELVAPSQQQEEVPPPSKRLKRGGRGAVAATSSHSDAVTSLESDDVAEPVRVKPCGIDTQQPKRKSSLHAVLPTTNPPEPLRGKTTSTNRENHIATKKSTRSVKAVREIDSVATNDDEKPFADHPVSPKHLHAENSPSVEKRHLANSSVRKVRVDEDPPTAIASTFQEPRTLTSSTAKDRSSARRISTGTEKSVSNSHSRRSNIASERTNDSCSNQFDLDLDGSTLSQSSQPQAVGPSKSAAPDSVSMSKQKLDADVTLSLSLTDSVAKRSLSRNRPSTPTSRSDRGEPLV